MSIIQELNHLEYMKDQYKENHEDRIEIVSELCNMSLSGETEGRPFSEFMEDSLLASNQNRISQKESIKIMTIHAAKGLEWSVIFPVEQPRTCFQNCINDNQCDLCNFLVSLPS